MLISRVPRAALVVPVVLAAVALVGCSAEVSVTRTASAEKLAAQVDDALQDLKSDDASVSDVTCDGDLDLEDEGAEQTCSFTDVNEDRYGVTVTVNPAEDDDNVHLDVDPGQTVPPEELIPVLDEKLTAISGGIEPDDVTCPEGLRGYVGAMITCVLTAGEDTIDVAVTVTTAEGPDVGFDIEVAQEVNP